MTLAVEVRLLTGRYTATHHNDWARAEWPPHPARLFSAAVAAWADADVPDPRERAALEWWECQGRPTITCSPAEHCGRRALVTHFVPVNDVQVVSQHTRATYAKLREAAKVANGAASGSRAAQQERRAEKAVANAVAISRRVTATGVAPSTALSILPDQRAKQGRFYPTIVPELDVVTYVWPEASGDGPEVAALDGVFARVARLGHSSCLVSVGVTPEEPTPTFVPDDSGQLVVRLAAPGQLSRLEQAFARHQGEEPRALPAERAFYRRWRPASLARPASTLADAEPLLLGIDGRGLSIVDTLAVARTLRSALMTWCPAQPPPEALCGHPAGKVGAVTVEPHVAYVPLPFVGRPYATGLIQGVAVFVPAGVDEDSRRCIAQSVQRWLTDGGGELRLGRAGKIRATMLAEFDSPVSARPRRWRGPSRLWASATPVVLDRNPGQLLDRDRRRRARAEEEATATIRRACEHIGLPQPTAVALSFDPPLEGSRPARHFGPYATGQTRQRHVLVHVELAFDTPIAGPVILGAGRYFGFGLCLPIDGHAGGRRG